MLSRTADHLFWTAPGGLPGAGLRACKPAGVALEIADSAAQPRATVCSA